VVYGLANLSCRAGHISAPNYAAPNDDYCRATGHGLCSGEGIYAPRRRDRSCHLLHDIPQEIDGISACHLLVYAHMNADVVHSQGLQLPGALYRIRHSEQIHHYLYPVLPGRSHGILNGGVV